MNGFTSRSPGSALSRRAFLQRTGAGAASMLLPAATRARAASTRPPNILLILLDDLGKEWVGCCGGEGIETPHIDALAAGGMRFTNAYAMPKCTPTRTTLLTGQYPFRHGWVDHWDVPRWGCGCHFDPKHYTTFAQVMKSAGYATAAAGKWQINDFRVQPDVMERHGFDDYCMWTGYETGNPPSAERYWNPYLNTKEGSRTYTGRFGGDVFTDFLIDFMRQNKDRPMMLYYPMCLTHGPFVTTPREPDAKTKLEKHKAMVHYADHLLGRLLAAMDELHIREDTLVFWTTDNGSSGALTGRLHGRDVRGGKGTLRESGVNMPFIVNGPGRVPAGVVTDALTDFSDLLPTFAALGGATLSENVPRDGHSIAEVLLGKTQTGPRSWIMAMGGGTARLEDGAVHPAADFADRVVRDTRYKLWVEKGRPTGLFDLAKDPGEKANLLDHPEPEAVAARERLEAIAREFPKKDAAPQYDPLPPQPWDTDPGKPAKRKEAKK